jgi:hypothetical protein
MAYYFPLHREEMGMGGKRNVYRILVGKQEERDYWEDLYVGESIILK